MLTPRNETENQIAEAEHKNRLMDDKQAELLYMASEMLSWAMKDQAIAQIMREARNDMHDRKLSSDFLKSLA